ncbi:hypothetical protein FQR65_LT14928 [Abscondita terminalis]|nr:hypothetical protein FQR65_LT14928 [Abscondita terminalis]
MYDEQKNSNCLKKLRSYASECCADTSIHGCKFLGEKKRSLFERTFWLSVLITSLFFCTIWIIEAYYKWQTTPVVVSFATTETPIWNIPFPAVTICPEVKTDKSFVNFMDLLIMKKNGQKFSDVQKKYFNYLLQICSTTDLSYKGDDEYVSEDFYNFLFEAQPRFSDMIDECLWSGLNCTSQAKSTFTPLITSDGLCFSFNLLDRSDLFTEDVALNYYKQFNIPHQMLSNWKLDEGYNVNYSENDMPRRTGLAGISGGLQITLFANSSNFDYSCGDAIQGYKIMVHNPLELPFARQKYFRIGLNQVVTAAVMPVIVSTSKQVQHYEPNRRQCYFAEEKKLRFFKIYDQKNCLQECASNLTYELCGCVSFEMPRLNSTPICGSAKLDCVFQTFANGTQKLEYFGGGFVDLMKSCDCKQTCSSIKYEVELSQVEWKWRKRAKILTSDDLSSKLLHTKKYTKLQIFFKDFQFITSERNELYGLMDFLSSCGGLLGLFVGFSLISFIEVIYFFTLRIMCNCRLFGTKNWSECCAITSIHGCKFLGEKKRSFFERTFWMIVLITCLFFCSTWIIEAYHKWQTTPVVVSFATTETPIWKIPFPAVTICPEVKTDKSYVNYTDLVLMKKRGDKLNETQNKYFKYLTQICLNEDVNQKGEDDFVTEDFYDFLFQAQPKFTEMIDECLWSGINCTDYAKSTFSPLVTSDGLCFTFNFLDRNDLFTEDAALNYYSRFNISHQVSSNWQLDDGYKDDYGKNDMPRRTGLAGISGGLQITFLVNSNNFDYFCGDAIQGYKIMVHNPSELPFAKQKYFRIGLNEVVTAAIKPVIVITSKQLRHYEPKKRECYFAEEKKLRFFKIYEQNNCLHECLSNLSYEICGCVSFEMPRSNSTPICGSGKLDCMSHAFDNGTEDLKPNGWTFSDLMEYCGCKQTCSSIKYDVELSQVEWNWQKRAKTNRYTKLLIFFNDFQFITSERNELYGLMDFLSSCGGLLGLFVGFSLISFVEIVYFITLRIMCNCRLFGNKNWSGE